MRVDMAQASTSQESTIRLMFGGDVMLGRIVKDYIQRYGPGYPLGPVAKRMRDADLTIINLECAITASEQRWSGAAKAYYFGAPPQAAEALTGAGVDLVSLANNHVLDFDIAGLRETLHHLHRLGIAHAGAGEDIKEALSPAIMICRGIKFGMAAFCDHQADFAAGADRPGIAFIDFNDELAALALIQSALERLRNDGVDWPILSLHWGPNMVDRPSVRFRQFAHAAIDMGWKILFGHSAHVFHGIEIYRGVPIIYAAGDLVDDYRVDPEFRNDHQVLFEMELSHDRLRRISLHPVFIDDCQVRPAIGEQFEYIARRMVCACAELGTTLHLDNKRLWIEGCCS